MHDDFVPVKSWQNHNFEITVCKTIIFVNLLMEILQKITSCDVLGRRRHKRNHHGHREQFLR